jgi:hypothetical protein
MAAHGPFVRLVRATRFEVRYRNAGWVGDHFLTAFKAPMTDRGVHSYILNSEYDPLPSRIVQPVQAITARVKHKCCGQLHFRRGFWYNPKINFEDQSIFDIRRVGTRGTLTPTI